MERNKLICLQFWYHMFGKHTGQLNVYIATNTSETLTWSQSGNQGDRWMLAQTTLTSQLTFKVKLKRKVDKVFLFYLPGNEYERSLVSTCMFQFILEGVTLEGSKGDIAVDDVTVLEEGCRVISRWSK